MNDITQNNFSQEPNVNYPFNRLLLFKMYQILEKVDLPNAELHCLHKNVIRECRVEQYPLLFEELTPENERISPAVMRTVEAIIEMYVHLNKSYRTLSDELQQQIMQHPYYNFIGFNLNEETDYEYYANYYLNDLVSYDSVLNLDQFHSMVTKPKSLQKYSAMLKQYEKYKINTYLTYGNIIRILS